jgi:hypothetical protein
LSEMGTVEMRMIFFMNLAL